MKDDSPSCLSVAGVGDKQFGQGLLTDKVADSHIWTAPAISMVESATRTNTTDINARLVIGYIRLGTWREPVAQIREIFSEIRKRTSDRKTAKQSVDRSKKTLAAFMWSGRFSRRANDAIIEHSGLLCADLDELAERLPDVGTKLRRSPYLWALFLSPTGDGLKAVFRVPADASKHTASFRAVEQHVLELAGIQIDQACKDVARMCFVSYDPDAYLNPNAREIAQVLELQKPRTEPASGVPTSNLETRRRIAVELLGEIQWDSRTHGLCTCPGKNLHTTGDGQRDCEIHLDGAPTIHCFHNSCAKLRDELNYTLRSCIVRAESLNEAKPTQRGRSGQLALTPSKWFSERFPSLANEYGDAVLEKTDENGILVARGIGEDFLAATLGDNGSPESPTIFLPTEEKFYTYAPKEGIFVHRREPAFLTQLSRLLLRCARECEDACDTSPLGFRLRNSATLYGVLRKARGILDVPTDFFSTDLTDFIPCSNGMLRLKDKQLLPFNPSYHRRNKLAVPFDPAAKCPLFLDTLMQQALDPDELDLLQRWCGLALIGENVAQRTLILTGTAGGGKGTFIRVLSGIIGQNNLGSLRPQLLGERFELGRFLGRTLLYGADVSANFLDQRGATVLKALSGADPVTLEFKNSNESPCIICRFNVIVTCNSRLTVRLEGDVEAWRRRLVIVEYRKPKPEKVIADLDRQILERESSGVLNWMLDGLDKLRAAAWQLVLTANQQNAVNHLLLESDGHAIFARECLKPDSARMLTLPDAYAIYVEFCTQRGWMALSRNKFTTAISDEVVRQFGITTRNDVPDAKGKAQRGWKRLACREQFTQLTNETVSELSANEDSDTSDTLFSVQPERVSLGKKPELVEEFV
jgi:P4 family phage/plasmid primase-like protien